MKHDKSDTNSYVKKEKEMMGGELESVSGNMKKMSFNELWSKTSTNL